MSKFKKIALIHLNLATESGDPRVVFSFAQTLKNFGHEVTIYTLDFNPDCFPDFNKGLNIKVISPPQKTSFLKDLLFSIDKDFDLITCHNDESYKIGIYYKKINPKTKIIWVMHNAPFEYLPKPNFFLNSGSKVKSLFNKLMVKKFSRGINKIVTLDEKGLGYGNFLGLPTMINRLGVNFKFFYAPVKKFPNKDKSIQLLGVGALSRFRRFEDIIYTVSELRKKDYQAKAVLVCKDFWKDSTYKKEFTDYIKKLGIKDYIKLLLEGASDNELRDLYHQSNIFIFPNHIRIWGIAAFEAMAAGLPVIVSNVTSVAEVLKDGENALFVEPLKPDQIVSRIELFISNPQLYREIAESGQKITKENLSWESYTKKILDFAFSN